MEEDLPVNLANWPEDWAERGIGETLLAAPELLVMWSRTRLSRPRRPGRVDTLAGLRAHFDLPGRLYEEPQAPPRRHPHPVCTWLVVVEPQAISGRSGYVPASAMSVIHQKTAAQALGGWP